MNSRSRTYRVPKRVQLQVENGLEDLSRQGLRMDDGAATRMASVLTSQMPVDISVAVEIDKFFTHDWRFHPSKARVAALYGGELGRQWAHKCAVSNGAVTAAAAPTDNPPMSDEEMVELTTFTDADILMILGFGKLAEIIDETVPGAKEQWEKELAVIEAKDEVEDKLEDAVDLSSNGAPPGVEFVLDEDSMFQTAVAESLELAAGAAPAGDAGAAEGVAPEAADDAAPRSTEEPAPVNPEKSQQAKEQVRDSNGRFAKTGARVQGKNGNYGWVEGQKDGQAVIMTDSGEQVLVDPADFTVVTAPGRARLEEPPEVVEDPAARVESYQAWAQEQMPVTAAAEDGGPDTTTGTAAPSPLFFAEVDEVDTTAVLALIAVIPTNQGEDFVVYERRDGKWIEAPDYVRDIQSVNPPALVELDNETLLMVIEQMDASDLANQEE